MSPNGPKIYEKKMNSTWHMGGHQINNINFLEQDAHEKFIASFYNPALLYPSIELIYQAYIIFRGILSEKQRTKLDRNFEKYLTEAEGKIRLSRPTTEYKDLRKKVRVLFRDYFYVKQLHNLNFPTEISEDDRSLIEGYVAEA